MRKIESQEETERKEKRRNRIIGKFLLGLLVLSSLGFAFLYRADNGGSTDTSNVENTDAGVQNVGNQWIANREGQQLIFSSSPDSTKNISINISKKIDDFVGAPLYIASNNDGIYYEIYSNLGKYTSEVQEACYGKCEKNLPEKNCTQGQNIIVWKEAEENRVYENDYCIFIEGDMRGVDAFLYRILRLD